MGRGAAHEGLTEKCEEASGPKTHWIRALSDVIAAIFPPSTFDKRLLQIIIRCGLGLSKKKAKKFDTN
jgi:hypothetical protein